MRQKKITIKGKELSYYETRDNGDPVVLVHGMSSASSIFIRQLIDSVLSYQFRFIAVDLIGYGNSQYSDDPEKDYTLNGLSDFLIAFDKALNIKNAVYAGHNMGANIILEAYEHFINPKGIVLLGAVPFPNPFNEYVFSNEADLELFSKSGIDDSEVHQLAGYFVEKDTMYPDFIPEIIRKADKKTRSVLFKSIEKGEYSDQLKIIQNIKGYVAVYYGEFDRIINLKYLEDLNIPDLWKNRIQIIKDVGQMFFYECPADFNLSLETFLVTSFNRKRI